MKGGVPSWIRTNVPAVKGQYPRPLDDRDVLSATPLALDRVVDCDAHDDRSTDGARELIYCDCDLNGFDQESHAALSQAFLSESTGL